MRFCSVQPSRTRSREPIPASEDRAVQQWVETESVEELVDLLAHGPHLSLNRRRILAGRVQGGQTGLAFLHRIAEIGDTLAHRVETAMLQLEPFTALPHLLAQIGQRLTSRLLGFLGLRGHALKLLGARHDLGLHRGDFGDLGLDGAEAADLLLLPAQPGIQLAIEPGELGDLGRGAIHRLTLLLQRGACVVAAFVTVGGIVTECKRMSAELGVRITSVAVSRPTLDDVFLSLTGRSLREESEVAS